MKNIKRDNNLVVLKGKNGVTINHTEFYPNKYYRCITLSESEDNEQTLIYGEVFHKEQFNELFEYATDRTLRDWEAIGLLVKDKKDGVAKAISFTAFGKHADIHTYGRGRNKMRILYFRNSRECIYGFYPCNYTKVNDIRESYNMFLDTVLGNSEHLDDKSIQFGNRGIPLQYGDLRVWKETPKPFLI